MMHCFLKNGRRTVHFTFSFIIVFVVCRTRAQDFFAGARGGASLDDGGARYRQAEAFGGILGWHWHFVSNWYLRPGADASLGCLTDGNNNGFVGTIGPLVELGKGRFPITVEAGAAPTFLSRHHFSSRNFGDNFEFTSHIGLNWRVSEHFTLGARIQHMSNAGFAHENPGVNMEFLSLRYNF